MDNAKTHELFVNELPQLQRMAAAKFRHLDLDKREEAIQNTLAIVWKSFCRLNEKGRADEPGILKSILWYAIRQTKAGRTIQGKGRLKAKDALDYEKKGKVRFEIVTLEGFISKRTPIPDIVSFRVDVPQFISTLTKRQQAMAHDFIVGMTTSEVAKKHGVTPGAVSQVRGRIKKLFDEYFAA